MCIRDRGGVVLTLDDVTDLARAQRVFAWGEMARQVAHEINCLLYTSDAADERSSVDLGGRRIIKKKKTVYLRGRHETRQNSEGKHSDH